MALQFTPSEGPPQYVMRKGRLAPKWFDDLEQAALAKREAEKEAERMAIPTAWERLDEGDF